MTKPTPTPPTGRDPELPTPVQADTLRIIEIGMAVWVVALIVTLVVPPLHEGSRHWWPWVPVAGTGLGALGWGYLRRGRGNATAA